MLGKRCAACSHVANEPSQSTCELCGCELDSIVTSPAKRPRHGVSELAPEPPPPPEVPVRISASKVAAVCGYHPFAELHPLFLDHLYQDAAVRSLDMATVGLRLVSRDEEVEQLLSQAKRAGGRDAAAAAELGAVLQRGSSLQTAAGVQRLTQKATALISGLTKVSAPQRAALQSGVATSLNTGFGTRHEADALGLYERRTGCTVRETNESLWMWRFSPDSCRPPWVRVS
jgi:hypothetical protein